MTISPVIVAQRVDPNAVADLSEIADLARAAGYDVSNTLTQSREEDAAYHFGEGKIEALARLVKQTDAEAVIVDNRLGPYQTYNIGGKLPTGVEVIDRFTLILEIFGQRANTRKAQLQVELAELRYELPRVEAKSSLAKRDERPGFMGLGEYDESRERDIKAQISRISQELDAIAEKEQTRREQRRESGFDLVALAGYTNAGSQHYFADLRMILILPRIKIDIQISSRRLSLRIDCSPHLERQHGEPIPDAEMYY
jgi:GTP-binding protein HflX (EC 3.1.5.-)